MLSSKEECGIGIVGEITRGASIKPTIPLSDFEQGSR